MLQKPGKKVLITLLQGIFATFKLLGRDESKMKKVISSFLTVILTVLLVQPAWAGSSFPQAFWKLADRYAEAVNGQNDASIIEAGKAICELLESSPKNPDTVAVLGTRYQDIAQAYERQKDFVSAAEYYQKYLPYGQQLGWEDGVRIAEAKADYYTPILNVYMETGNCPVFYGAKNEPVSGVLYGQVSEQSRANESMVLIYEEFGNPISDWNIHILEEAAQAGKAVEMALNFPQEGTTAAQVPLMLDYIDYFINTLAPFARKTPIFLRIGAEMNVWSNRCEPEVFITAYRTVAESARRLAPELALVWSPNYVSEWNVDVTAYYPGDEYVDWVGLSVYMGRYFQNRYYEENDRTDEILFKAGRASDPVFLVKQIVEEYGDRKPIMVAEGGASHYNEVLGADSTAWAMNKVREFYGYLPMVYPQIKLISYFNNKIAGESNDYSLKNSSALEDVFYEATQAEPFIKNSASGSGTSFVKLDGRQVQTAVTVASYVHLYGQEAIKVEYRVDGQWVALSDKAPYRATLNLTPGVHEITSSVLSEEGMKLLQQTATVTASEKITILYNGRELNGDVPACISGGRTLVPLRLIFSAMGAQVDWDAETRTIHSVLGDKTVTMQVDNPVMERNGEKVTLDVPPVIKNGRTLVPVRAVAEAFGADVQWNGAQRTVVIEYL